MSKITKDNAYIQPNVACEYGNECKFMKPCYGASDKRIPKFGCGLRRGLIIAGIKPKEVVNAKN